MTPIELVRAKHSTFEKQRMNNNNNEVVGYRGALQDATRDSKGSQRDPSLRRLLANRLLWRYCYLHVDAC